MSSPAVIDVESLLLPIPGDAPAGPPMPHDVRLELDEFRKDADPFDPGTADLRADWAGVVRIARDTLTNTSKDLLAAVRLTEALAKKDGPAGLRDGLRLLTRLCGDCWDRMHPMPEEGEGMDIREGPFKWLNDVTRGAKFPFTVTQMPLVQTATGTFAYVDWLTPDKKPDFEEGIPTADPKKLRNTYEDLTEAQQALKELAKVLDEKMGADVAPDFLSPETDTNVGTALGKCLRLVEDVAKRRGASLKDGPAPETAGPQANGQPAGTPPLSDGGPPSAAASRDGMYRQLEQIADGLQRLEPHSPIPYLLRRCVRLGAMPFPDLMREMVRETATLDEFDRLLGTAKPAEAAG